ncbi:MAG: 1-deoxy-D-xylulose-5-phosphate synthase [bacterium]
MNSILDKVNSPADLKNLSVPEMEHLAGEIRGLIIDTVSRTGGHLAPNLGVVELTIAILRLFNPPADRIVWDVGHQTYTWKILTGRKARFGTLRQSGGISGFPRREESEYDVFGTGHSGTAISAALGLAAARDRLHTNEHVIAVLGDGSLGCGISLEGLNNISTTTNRMIVILNDNEMSISANVGATARYLGRLLASPRYNRWKGSIEQAARRLRLGRLRRLYYKIEELLKSVFLRSVLFEELGLRYIGPVDGHSIPALIDALTIAKDYDRPIIVHVSTQKGKGYSPAEAEPEEWHGRSCFNVATGETLSLKTTPTYSAVFGSVMERLAGQDNRIVAITAAMSSGTGLADFARRFPDRFFDVGICEEHAVVFAAGLAAAGMKPVFAVYSTFSQRAVDCIIHDVCLQSLPVIICLDRAGIVGDDGPTHHGVFDIALLRAVPNLIMAQPENEAELANMLYSATKWEKPVVIRYPRGTGRGTPVPDVFSEIQPGKAEVVREGGVIQIWALGDMVELAGRVAEILANHGLSAGVVNARFVRPLDEALLARHASSAQAIVSIENGVATGGFGASLGLFLAAARFEGTFLPFGWPDEFLPHGTCDEISSRYGMTVDSIAAAILKEFIA